MKAIQRSKSQYKMLEDQMQALFNKTKTSHYSQTDPENLD